MLFVWMLMISQDVVHCFVDPDLFSVFEVSIAELTTRLNLDGVEPDHVLRDGRLVYKTPDERVLLYEWNRRVCQLSVILESYPFQIDTYLAALSASEDELDVEIRRESKLWRVDIIKVGGKVR